MIQLKRSLVFALLLYTAAVQAQNVAINTDGAKANPNAMLDIKSADKGLLIPRMSSEARLKIPNTQGLLVYDVNTNSFWYNTGRTWLSIHSATTAAAVSATDAWLLGGNAGTVDGTHFLGTNDGATFLNIRVNNNPSGRIDGTLRNTYWGFQSGVRFTSGTDNTGIGATALFYNTTGTNNTGLGSRAVESNTTGFANTGTGRSALYSNTTGSNNTASGAFSLYSNNTGSNNTAIGVNALHDNTTGGNNTAVGMVAMPANTTGTLNTAVGVEAMRDNTTGFGNSAVGYQALAHNMTGVNNTAMGHFTMGFSGIGNNNAAFGMAAMQSTHTGNQNSGFGSFALSNTTTGNSNAALGYSAMAFNNSGSGLTGVGAQCNVSTFGLTNATAIGFQTIVDASNKVRIGNASVTVIEGQVPFTTPSDGRYKFGVQEDVKGLDFILQLRPVTYQFDVKRFDAELGVKENEMNEGYNEALQLRRSGFIAQEVEQAATKSGYNFSGIIKPKNAKEHYSLSYDAFVVPLVKGMQEQQQVIDDQQKTIQEQDKKITDLQRQLDELKNAVKKLQSGN